MRDRLQQFFERIVPSGTIAERAIQSGIWMSGIKLSGQGLQLLMYLVLARVLAPRDFGLMGIALLALSALDQLTNIGIDTALVHQIEDDVDEYLDTTWCLEVGRGLLATTLLFVAAPHLGAFFSEPRATPLIRVIAFSPLIYGLRNPGIIYFQKNLEFHREFVYQTSSAAVQFAVGVGYALVYESVWALVFGFLAADAVQTLLSYRIHPYRPWPQFDRSAAADLINYGKWITGSSIIYFIYRQGDDAFVGWFLSATTLGFYQYALRIADMPTNQVSEVAAKVTFPSYSKLQEEPARLRTAFLQTMETIGFVVAPMAFGIALVAPSFVPVALGRNWLPIVLPLQIFAVYALFHGFARNIGALWKALGVHDLDTKIGVLRVLLIALFIWPATARYGIEGSALVITSVFVLVVIPLNVYLTAKTLSTTNWAIYRTIFYPALASSLMFVVLWGSRLFVELSPLVELLVFVPAGVILYVAATLLIQQQFDWDIEDNLRLILDGVSE
jgi:PST family polysaccharide transporter/lipopolysaccharide exporter